MSKLFHRMIFYECDAPMIINGIERGIKLDMMESYGFKLLLEASLPPDKH